MIKLGIFYCPEYGLVREVETIKSFFKEKSKKNKYLNHLVHSTIYVFETEEINLDSVIEIFELLRNDLTPLSIQINNWRVFEDDVLTGLNTLCLEVELTKNLILFQKKIVESLHKFITIRNRNNFKGDLKFSNEKYGYPYVGDHWIPHITIGSLDLKPGMILNDIKPFFDFPKKIKFNNLSIYSIDGDSHTLIKKKEFRRKLSI